MRKRDFKPFTKVFGGKKETIYHNLSTVPGMEINGAYVNWAARTKEFTPESFVAYINSKSHMTGSEAMIQEDWLKLK